MMFHCIHSMCLVLRQCDHSLSDPYQQLPLNPWSSILHSIFPHVQFLQHDLLFGWQFRLLVVLLTVRTLNSSPRHGRSSLCSSFSSTISPTDVYPYDIYKWNSLRLLTFFTVTCVIPSSFIHSNTRTWNLTAGFTIWFT